MLKKNKALKKKNSWPWNEMKNKKTRLDFFQTGRRFNIFVTLANYCGGYPKEGGRGACSWLGVPDEYPRAMTAEVSQGEGGA